jgi:hypothetical protein
MSCWGGGGRSPELVMCGSEGKKERRKEGGHAHPTAHLLRPPLLPLTPRVDAAGQLYYEMEFTVASPTFSRHNLAVYASRNGLLYTLNCQCRQAGWGGYERQFMAAANSFRILESGAGRQGFPEQL